MRGRAKQPGVIRLCLLRYKEQADVWHQRRMGVVCIVVKTSPASADIDRFSLPKLVEVVFWFSCYNRPEGESLFVVLFH